MLPTATNICLQCISSSADVTEGISTEGVISRCSQCDRYYGPPWQVCPPESKELMGFCLKKVKGLEKVRVVDSDFVWTEAHSKRMKIRVKVQREVQSKQILESTVTVEFVMKNLQCDECKKTWTPNKWVAIIHLRQKATSKQTILFLEQLILNHGMHKKVSNIKEMPDGLDFGFGSKISAMEFVAFIQSQMICRQKLSKKYISSDKSSYIYEYIYTFSVEVPSVSKGDLMVIPPKLQRELGGTSSLCLVLKVASLIILFDPVKVKVHAIDGNRYWSHEPQPICTKGQLTEYLVTGIRPLRGGNAEYTFAELTLQRPDNSGKQFKAKSHLGRVLKLDDKVLVYDLSVITNGELEVKKSPELNLVVVKKSYQNKERKGKLKLKRLDKEKIPGKKESKWQIEKEEKEYEEFAQDLEEEIAMEQERAVVNSKEVEETTEEASNAEEEKAKSKPSKKSKRAKRKQEKRKEKYENSAEDELRMRELSKLEPEAEDNSPEAKPKNTFAAIAYNSGSEEDNASN